MLRLLPKSVTLHVSPQGFALASQRGGALDPALQPWPDATGLINQSAAASALTRLPWPLAHEKKALDVVLDNAWVRLQLVNFPNGVRSREERNVYLKSIFRGVFGAEADGWQIISEHNRMGIPSLAMAADFALLNGLRQLAEQHKLRLRSMNSSFVATFNRLRARLSARQGALAQIEAGRACIGIWQNHMWMAFRNQPIVPSGSIAVADLLGQMLPMVDPPLRAGMLYLVGPSDAQTLKPVLPDGWNFTWLNNGL